jgi:hypothetical protein
MCAHCTPHTLPGPGGKCGHEWAWHSGLPGPHAARKFEISLEIWGLFFSVLDEPRRLPFFGFGKTLGEPEHCLTVANYY